MGLLRAAGVTDRLWEVSGLVALLEAEESEGQRAALGCYMTESASRYIVYVNDPHKKSVGHVESCPHTKIWGGETTKAGGWIGPFSSREQARRAGELSGNPFRWCGHCGGKSK